MNFTDAQIQTLLQAVVQAVQYHEGAPAIAELQAAYESMTGQSAFPYRDEDGMCRDVEA
ncbi:hypothetical protein [Xanthomonas citri]|uniref:hypothetical protein n=1 Tax=Xanthomonas citri TaxID=346 RepID=UPI0012FDCAFE|nr:hypothetical protein [Xanthomonas citri]